MPAKDPKETSIKRPVSQKMPKPSGKTLPRTGGKTPSMYHSGKTLAKKTIVGQKGSKRFKRFEKKAPKFSDRSVKRFCNWTGGVRISAAVYELVNKLGKAHMHELAKKAMIYTYYGRRKTINPSDALMSIKNVTGSEYCGSKYSH